MLQLDAIQKVYGSGASAFHAVKDYTLSVKEGEFFTFVGPSGCGKTTGLRMIAGLETPSAGEIRIDGKPVYSARGGLCVPVNQRDISMVFQSYAIWPHMSVGENVRFPLDVMGLSGAAAAARVAEALATVGMPGMENRPATDLSGGQQQRVALARAMVKNAKLMLLDEPLSNLDAELRVHMRGELRSLQARLGVTFVYVTHDQEEAMSLSDRVAILKDGHVVEVGTPQDLYYRPKQRFTATFLGLGELWDGTVREISATGTRIETRFGMLASTATGFATGDQVKVLARPEHIEISAGHQAAQTGALHGTVTSAAFSGRYVDYAVACGRQTIQVQTGSQDIIATGAEVTLRIAPNLCIVLP